MWDLGQVVGVLLDPPDHGRALLREDRDDGADFYQAAWSTERPMQAGRWYLRRQTARAHETRTFDGITHRLFQGLKLVEQHTSRPDYWPPALHLLLPIKAWFWGRSCDDWRMHPDVRSEHELAVVRLSHTEKPHEQARLVVDMERRLLVRYERPGSILTLRAINRTLGWEEQYDKAARRVSDERWLPVEPEPHAGLVRYGR
jgi:hypothetical protein